MKISELSSPEVRQLRKDPLSDTLSQIETLIKEIERCSPEIQLTVNLTSNFREHLTNLSKLSPLSNSTKLQIWKLSYRLWNVCVDISNAIGIRSFSSGGKLNGRVENVELRQISADLLWIAYDVVGVPSPVLKVASFYYKTGLSWHDLRKFDLASNCFEKATSLTSKTDIDSISDREERKLLLDLNIARARTAWEVSDRNVSITLLNRSKKCLFESAENYRTLANQYLVFGKELLSENETSEINEVLKLMNEALELCEKGLRVVKKTDETLRLKALRDKALRFIAAVHLQREEFESVIKCVRVLRDNSSDQHPSLSVLAMKAWLGLGRNSEAEKELRVTVMSKGMPEAIWLSSFDAYLKTVGVGGMETLKSVFLEMLSKSHISPSAAARLIYKVMAHGDGFGGGEGLNVRAKVAAELSSDSRVLALFSGEGATKESSNMHAVLWNCAADYFRSSDYVMSAELFEKSMLYIPYGIEHRALRAKGFRVLCLCHLGLSRLDQAQEYIDEAEKLEPNIACAFLKFKIYLQKGDLDGAIAQVQAMTGCTDFTTDFLSLAAYEAVACRAITVAVASLSSLLNFYTSGKAMPIAEVVVFRTLITILLQDPGNEQEVLKFMKKAKARVFELGGDNFFGKGEVGRRERNWIAVNSWNIGTRTGVENNYELCAEFLRLASDFYGISLEEEHGGNEVMVCKSIILAVSALIAAKKQNKVSLLETEVKEAIELLNNAGKMLASASTGNKLADCQDNNIDPDFHFMYTLNAYELYGKLNDLASQQLAVKNFASLKACKPKHLLQIGLVASQGPLSNPEIAAFTLNCCLTSLLTSSTPDYQTVALVIRRLIMVAVFCKGDQDDDDDAVYSLYKQAYRIMVGLKEGEYPIDEGKWLATTAWNRASSLVRLGQIEAAKKWMNMGIELARNVPSMGAHKGCMEDYVAKFEKTMNQVGNKQVKRVSENEDSILKKQKPITR